VGLGVRISEVRDLIDSFEAVVVRGVAIVEFRVVLVD
jgi:hypothetical protein